MSTAMTILVNEHRFLGRMLDFAEDLATRMRRHEDVQPQTLGRAVEFFRVCMEGCLLAKEEDLLFPRLETKGLFRRGGVIASMLIDHERGRRLVSEMAKAAAEYEAGNSGAGDLWAAAALDFVDLMRTHLREEEASLFVMAESFLQAAEQAELAEEFKRLEGARTISARYRQIHQIPERLLAKADERIAGAEVQHAPQESSGTA